MHLYGVSRVNETLLVGSHCLQISQGGITAPVWIPNLTTCQGFGHGYSGETTSQNSLDYSVLCTCFLYLPIWSMITAIWD